MHFDIAAELRRVDRTSDTVCQHLTYLAKPVSRFVSQCISRVCCKMAGPYCTAGCHAEAPFLILKIHYRDRRPPAFTRGAGYFQTRHDPQCPVKPSSFGLAVGMRSQQQTSTGCDAKLVAHRIHGQCQARFRDFGANPITCCKFIRCEGRSYNTLSLPAGAKPAQLMQRLQKTVRIDVNHRLVPLFCKGQTRTALSQPIFAHASLRRGWQDDAACPQNTVSTGQAALATRQHADHQAVAAGV